MSPHRKKAYLYLILVAVIWGAAGPIIKFTLKGIDPLPFLAYRFAISSIFSVIYFFLKSVNLKRIRKNLLRLFIYGFLAFSLSLGSLFIGLDKSTVLDSIIISTIGPLVVTAGGAFFFRDRITRRERAGIAIVLLGALTNSLAPLIFGNGNYHLTGNLFLVGFLLFDSASTLYAKRAVKDKIAPSTLTNFGFIVGGLTLIPYVLATQGPANVVSSIAAMPFKFHLGVWYMALLSGTLAYFLFVRAQKSIEVSEAILFRYLQPIFSVPLAIFWLGEAITPTFIIGAILITAGIIIAERKK